MHHVFCKLKLKRITLQERGFSLVEMLVVLVIVAILVSAALPAITSIRGALSLDTVSQSVAGQLSMAHEDALAAAKPVDVCFFQIADYNGSTPKVFRAMQCFLEGNTTPPATGALYYITVTPVTKPLFFPATVKIVPPKTTYVSGNDVSGLLDNSTYLGIYLSSDPAIQLTTQTAAPFSALSLPPPYGSSSYTYFRIRSDGQIDQSSGQATTGGTAWTNASLTLILETAPTTSTGLPANYVTIQLNAITGSIQVFRP